MATRRDLDLETVQRSDMARLGSDLRGEMADLRAEMADLRTEMADLRTEFAGLRAELATFEAGMHRTLGRHVWAVLAANTAVVSRALALVRLG